MRQMGSQQPRLKTTSIAFEQLCNSKVMRGTRHLAFPRLGGEALPLPDCLRSTNQKQHWNSEGKV